MDNRFDKLEEKLDKLDTRLDDIDKTLVKQHEQLTYHIKRSDQADAAIDIIEERVKPLEAHLIFVNNAIKIIIACSGIATFLFSIYSFFKD